MSTLRLANRFDLFCEELVQAASDHAVGMRRLVIARAVHVLAEAYPALRKYICQIDREEYAAGVSAVGLPIRGLVGGNLRDCDLDANAALRKSARFPLRGA
jgi:hypothetical protein